MRSGIEKLKVTYNAAYPFVIPVKAGIQGGVKRRGTSAQTPNRAVSTRPHQKSQPGFPLSRECREVEGCATKMVKTELERSAVIPQLARRSVSLGLSPR
jgi:hypothetical protein